MSHPAFIHLQPGTTLPDGAGHPHRYHVVRLLAVGGQAVLYIARDALRGCLVVLKVHLPPLFGGGLVPVGAWPAEIARLLERHPVPPAEWGRYLDRVRRNLARQDAVAQDHPQVLPVLEVLEPWAPVDEGGTPLPVLVAVMPYARHGDLLRALRRLERDLRPFALALLEAGLEVLCSLHACGFTHGDVRPGNLLLMPEVGPTPLVLIDCDAGHHVSDDERTGARLAPGRTWLHPDHRRYRAGDLQALTPQQRACFDVVMWASSVRREVLFALGVRGIGEPGVGEQLLGSELAAVFAGLQSGALRAAAQALASVREARQRVGPGLARSLGELALVEDAAPAEAAPAIVEVEVELEPDPADVEEHATVPPPGGFVEPPPVDVDGEPAPATVPPWFEDVALRRRAGRPGPPADDRPRRAHRGLLRGLAVLAILALPIAALGAIAARGRQVQVVPQAEVEQGADVDHLVSGPWAFCEGVNPAGVTCRRLGAGHLEDPSTRTAFDNALAHARQAHDTLPSSPRAAAALGLLQAQVCTLLEDPVACVEARSLLLDGLAVEDPAWAGKVARSLTWLHEGWTLAERPMADEGEWDQALERWSAVAEGLEQAWVLRARGRRAELQGAPAEASAWYARSDAAALPYEHGAHGTESARLRWRNGASLKALAQMTTEVSP